MAARRQVVLASSNQGKLREISAILAPLEIDLIAQSRFDLVEAEETGTTFVENAIIKARHAASHTGLPAIADDSGIEVDCLAGEPGIYSARYAGAGASDQENLELLLANAFATGEPRPRARFQCLMVFMTHAADPTPVVAQGIWHGWLVSEPRGRNGFGYDPIFYVPEENCTSGELSPEVKNRLSHRGQALADLSVRLAGRFT